MVFQRKLSWPLVGAFISLLLPLQLVLEVDASPPSASSGRRLATPGPPVHADVVKNEANSFNGRAKEEGLSTESATCTFDHECDDCSACTVDRCVGGTCLNAPRDICASCSDGSFCNGPEICDVDGNCAPSALRPCDYDPGEICDEEGGPIGTGGCPTPCTMDAECDDALECTGMDVCALQECVGGSNAGTTCTSDTDCDTAGGGFCGGVCRSPDPPCGAVEACMEDFCDIGGLGHSFGDPCASDADCGPGGHCTVGAGCVMRGRCCTDDGSGDFLVCSRASRTDCDAVGGRWLFVGDDPRTVFDEANCTNPAPSTASNAGEHFQCPHYSAGIASAGVPGTSIGPIAFANCAAIHELGDDYVIAGADAGNEFIEVRTVRYVGGFESVGIQGDPSDVRLSFYDTSGALTAETTSNALCDDSTQLCMLPTSGGLIVPARGWMTISASVQYAPFGRHHWVSTDAVDTGANDDTQLWVNGGPVAASTVLPPGAPGILAFEIVGNIVPSPLGACCNSDGALCSEQLPWACELAGGVFLGAGTTTCTPMPSACMTSACCDSVNGTCAEVSGGVCSDTGQPCLSDADCGGMTCQPPCPAGTISQGFGTSCSPNLCVQPDLMGYDTCVEAGLSFDMPHFVVVGMSACASLVATISGDNLAATFGDNPGSCEAPIFFPTGLTQDRGWWHAFETIGCTNVRIDFCGTQDRTGQAKQPIWANLWDACDPCGATIASSIVGGVPDGGCVGSPDAAEGGGGPFCGGGDSWVTFGPLPTGTYWYPVHTAPGGTWGPYQMHITASACPKAACCLPERLCVKGDDSLVYSGAGDPIPCVDDMGCSAQRFCDNNADQVCVSDAECPACLGGPTPGAACFVDSNCGAGGTCKGTSTCRAATCEHCAVANELDCDALDGKWNGFGSTRTQCPGGQCEQGTCTGGNDDGFPCDPTGSQPQTSCASGVCDIGACCLGLGNCEDRAVPVAPCNTADPATCMNRAQCETAPTNVFTGGAGCDDPLTPCNVCELVGTGNCQYPLGAGFASMSDLTAPGNAVVSADDFVPNGDTLTRLCVWGTYIDPSAPGVPGDQGYEQFSCVGMTSDHFRVRVFKSDDSTWTSGLPGTLVGQSQVTGANIVKGPEPNTAFERTFGIVMQGYTLTLDWPITGLVPGERHWLEVANNTQSPEGNTCFWHWAQHMPVDRDAQSVSGISPMGGAPDDVLARPSVYIRGSERGGADLAFCLGAADGPLDIVSPQADTAACWTCGDDYTSPQCSVTTLRQCIKDEGMWDRDDPSCTYYGPPHQPHDFCASYTFSNKIAARQSTCGDGVLDPGEQCDDGNLIPNDDCDNTCRIVCPAIDPPSIGALQATDGLYAFDNACANNDGPTLVRGEGADFAMDGDMWFEYTSKHTGMITASMCATQSGWTQDGYVGMDGALAMYHEYETRCQSGINKGAVCFCSGIPPKQRCIDTVQCPPCIGHNDPPGCIDFDPFDPLVHGLCQNECPCPGPYFGLHPWQVGYGADETCNGIADSGSGYIERVVFPGECYLIRVGAWLRWGGMSHTRGRGLLDLSSNLESPPFPTSMAEVELGTDRFGNIAPWYKPRMLSFLGGDAGRSQAVRVTFKQMPPGWEAWNGVQLFVQEPWLGSEVPGVSFYDPPDPGDPAIQVAELDCTPHFRDWSSLGVVHVFHPAFAPSKLLFPAGPVGDLALYDVQIIDETCSRHVEYCYSDPLEVRAAAWSDVVSLTNGEWRAPDDNVSVADTVAMAQKFMGEDNAPTKATMSLLGVTTGPGPALDGKISISELVAVLQAFGDVTYPYDPSMIPPPPGPCPP